MVNPGWFFRAKSVLVDDRIFLPRDSKDYYYYYYYYYKLYLGTVESSVKNFTIVNIYKFTVKLFTKKIEKKKH